MSTGSAPIPGAPLRITGLGSGMNIDGMVSKLMTAANIPLTELKQKEQLMSWKVDDYRGINTALASFRSQLDDFRFTGNWGLTQASSSDASIVSVTSSNGATTGSHTINVSQLAKGAVMSSTGTVSTPGLTGSATASTTTITQGSNDQFKVTLNGQTKTVTIAAGSYSQSALASQLQTSMDNAFGPNQITVSQSSGQISLAPVDTSMNPQIILNTVSGNTGLSTIGFNDGDSYKINPDVQMQNIAASKFATGTALTAGSFTINGVTISYSGTDTLNDVINRVNSSNAGVQMAYDANLDKITVNTTNTGQSAKISFGNDTGNFLSEFKLSTTSATGQDAKVVMDGDTSNPRYYSTNSFTLNNVTYNLSGTGTASVNVNQDIDGMVKKIEGFVNDYNTAVGAMISKLRESKYKNYPPLTDAQKSAMTDNQIKLWEDKAKSGLLQGDSTVQQFSDKLRGIVSQKVGSISTQYNALYQIGISTTSYSSGSSYSDAYKLTVNEDKLRQAISDDPNGVISMFANQPSSGSPESDKGIAQQMYDSVNSSITQLISIAGNVGTNKDIKNNDLGYQMYEMETNVTTMEAKLQTKQQQYYQMFTKMDNAIQQSNAQIAQLSSLG